MISVESYHIKRVVGRLSSGDNLLEELRHILAHHHIHYGTVTVRGRVDTVHVVVYDERKREWNTLLKAREAFELVTFEGRVTSWDGQSTSLTATAQLAGYGPLGQQFVYGTLKEATVVYAEFECIAPLDLKATHELDPVRQRVVLSSLERTDPDLPFGYRTGPPKAAVAPQVDVPTQAASAQVGRDTKRATSAKFAEPTATTAQTKSKTSTNSTSYTASTATPAPPLDDSVSSWNDAISATSNLKAAKEPQALPMTPPEDPKPDEVFGEVNLDEPIMSAGDILIHREFGRCIVMRANDDEFAHIRMPRGKIRKLKLSLLEITYLKRDEEKGVAIFEAKPRAPRR